MDIRRTPSTIKSIQRGVFNMSGTSGNQAVTAVTTAKSKLNFLGVTYSGSNLNEVSVGMQLTTATNIQFVRAAGVSGINVYWELVEFY